jgi:tripartite-type tricarboxylate transporter receptor subunit TctC
MMKLKNITRRSAMAAIGAAMAVCVSAGAVLAQSVEDFYKGKTITLIVGSGAGANDDLYARIFAKYLPKYMPGNPTVVVQNQPNAGGLVAATQLYATAPRDGTMIASVMRAIPTMPLVSNQPVNFDSSKLNWLGSLSKETNIIIVWETSPDKTFEDTFKRETVVGTTGGSSDSNIYALLLNQTLGTKFKIVGGYPGGQDLYLAMERGEVEGRVSTTWTSLKSTKPEWLKDNKVRILAQMGLTKNPELPDIPNVLDYVKDPKVREIYDFLLSRQEAGSPYVAPPEVPADRLAALRKAFMEVAADKDFLAEIAKINGTIEALSGEELQKMVANYYAMPADVIQSVKAALSPK